MKISLTIAFKPNEELMSALSSWAKENLKEKAVFDITVDPSIVGGAIIECDGLYRDESVRKILEDAFSKKEIYENIQRLLR